MAEEKEKEEGKEEHEEGGEREGRGEAWRMKEQEKERGSIEKGTGEGKERERGSMEEEQEKERGRRGEGKQRAGRNRGFTCCAIVVYSTIPITLLRGEIPHVTDVLHSSHCFRVPWETDWSMGYLNKSSQLSMPRLPSLVVLS